MPSDFRISIRGLDRLLSGLSRFPAVIKKNLGAAGKEAAETVILDTEGLRRYPPAGPGNAPPYPFYIRGRGTQVSAGRNLMNSQRLGTKFYVKSTSGANFVKTTIGNNAGYAKFVIGDSQAHQMPPIGWRRLGDIGKLKAAQVVAVFERWVAYTLKELGLQ